MPDDATEQIKALTAAINSLLQLHIRQDSSDGTHSSSGTQVKSHTDLYNQLSTRVEKYVYGSGDTTKPFEKWLLRHDYTIVTESVSLPPEMRTRLVLDKLGQSEFERLLDHVAPMDPSKMTLKDLLDTLLKLFCDKIPITRRRIEILNYRYDRAIPITEHIDRINRHAAEFDRTKLTITYAFFYFYNHSAIPEIMMSLRK